MNDDCIYLVEEESTHRPIREIRSKKDPFIMQTGARWVLHPRVIPYRTKLVHAWLLQKRRKKSTLRLELELDTGITLKHRDEKWRETVQLEVEIPFLGAKKLAVNLLKRVLAYEKKDKRILQKAVGK